MKNTLLLLLMLSLCVACNEAPRTGSKEAKQSAPGPAFSADSLRSALSSYIGTKNADIGVAVMGLEDGDTISVNGERFYSLMSVAKFPQALLLLHLVDEGKVSMAEPLHFTSADLKQRTGSSFRKDHPGESVDIFIPEALKYSIGQSDNITSNKIFELEGGPDAVTRYVQDAGVSDVKILTDYGHMGLDSMHRNRARPMAMVRLLERFFQGNLLSDSSRSLLWNTMVAATSGPDRIKGQLPPGTVVGHKTGTSGRNERTGVLEALNDIGIVELPDGRHFAIAVFVTNSSEPDAVNAEIIAHVSKLAWDYFMAKEGGGKK